MTMLLRLALITLLSFISSIALAQFPYIESFKNATAPGINFGGAPSSFLTAGGSAYNLQTLSHTGTPIDQNGNGYLRLTDKFNNQKGFIYSNSIFPSTQGLTVEFEYYTYGGNGADGISFFLFDAAAAPFNIGGFGGSLGYAQINTTIPTSPGVSKGYLAIGLDEFGNFSNPTEGRQGGISGQSPGSVTLRGKGDGPALTSGNYDFLTSVKTADSGFSLVGDASSRQPNSSSSGYRKVFMDLVPHPNGGYNITVRISRGGHTLITTTVIDNFHYPEVAPANLKYGIASSTGNQTNIHEIRNIFIDVLGKDNLVDPIATNDMLTVCQGIPVIIDIALNDHTENEGGLMDKASIDLDPAIVGLQKTLNIPGKGIFSINMEGHVVFTAEPTFTGVVSANYNIKDTYGKTSNNATITLTYLVSPQPNAGTDQFIDSNPKGTTFTMQGNDPGPSRGQWTQVSGPGQAVFINPVLYNTPVSNLINGVYILRWTLRSENGCELFDEVQLTVADPIIPAKIGLAKALTSKTRNMDGSFDLVYIFNLVNYGDKDGIYNISLRDDLESTFKKNTVIVKRLLATGDLHVNPGFNGFSVQEMLLPTSNLRARSKEQVTVEINVSLNLTMGIFNNTAFTQGISTKDGNTTSDQSTDGLIPDPDVPMDVSLAKPTPVNLNGEELFIPGGFSPNNDGINDYFVIENIANRQIQLEIFNRWGNRIYRSAHYKNEWNGKTTEGLHIGDDVPAGTYYYIMKIDGKYKKVGHLTISR